MIEMIVVMMVVSCLSMLSIVRISEPHFEHYDYLNGYLQTQMGCMKERRGSSYEKGVSFNSMGHVNMGKTISFPGKDVIIHLGSGYASLGGRADND